MSDCNHTLKKHVLSQLNVNEADLVGMDFFGYIQDSKTKAAVERKLLNIGEAHNQANQLNDQIQTKVTDFRKIIGFRNILVHGKSC